MKVLSSTKYVGEFEGKQYTKILLIVSDKGRWPQMVSCDEDVYNEFYNNVKGNIKSPEVRLLYENRYGKMKISKIEVI